MQEYVIGHYYSDLFAKRQSGDYEDFIIFDKKLIDKLFEEFYEFIDTVEKQIKK